MRDKVAAVVVGSGPNGLAAAITIARDGFPVIVFEAAGRAGGGVRSAELTLPGFMHDICSAVYPLAVGSPFFRELPLEQFGLKWICPKVCMAHPFDNEEPVILKQSVSATAEGLGEDFGSYIKWMTPFVKNWEPLLGDFLGPFKLPSYPALAVRFGWNAIQSAERLAKRRFRNRKSRALFGGLAAHSMLPLEKRPSAATGMMLAILGHAVGWPIPLGGAQNLTVALEKYLESLGGVIIKESPVKSMRELPPSQTVFFDLTPRQMLGIRELRFPEKYRRCLSRYRYGPGVFKIDWALDGEIPWKSRQCLEAGTLHLGGSLEEIARSENQVWQGRYPERPFVLLSQPSQFDKTRAPEGMQAVWAYCHVPHGSGRDIGEIVERQVERFAPGFRHRIVGRHTYTALEIEQHNPNYIGGDINGGIQDLRQLFHRPAGMLKPYRTPKRGIYICSSSTPPGGGVHGMGGYHAAMDALKTIL